MWINLRHLIQLPNLTKARARAALRLRYMQLVLLVVKPRQNKLHPRLRNVTAQTSRFALLIFMEKKFNVYDDRFSGPMHRQR